MKRASILLLALLFCLPAVGQQRHVNRYDIFTGYSYLNTPVISLTQHGFNSTVGINLRRWLALGADFSIWSGNTPLSVNQTKLAPTLSTALPASLMSYGLITDTSTWTFAAGPQINIRKWDKLTVFVRPGLGVMHEKIKIHYAGTPFQPLLGSLSSVAPGLSPSQADQVPFYGIGGGVDISASKHLGLRISFDYVHSSMFKSLLPSQNNFRLSFGPQIKLGEMKQTRK
jgi:hypothetical protein